MKAKECSELTGEEGEVERLLSASRAGLSEEICLRRTTMSSLKACRQESETEATKGTL